MLNKFLISTEVGMFGFDRAVQEYIKIRLQYPRYKHAVFTTNALRVSNRCFHRKGKCYGCVLV